jgi:hypothetical protein
MATAEELIAQAKSAHSEAELADIEAQADDRVTVQHAVDARRDELKAQGSQTVSESTTKDAPASGSAELETVESAPAHEVLPDALGNMPEEQPDPTTTDAEELQADQEVGVGGLALPRSGEIGGGNIKKLLAAPPVTNPLATPLAKEQAALKSPIGQKIAGMLARPVTEWGVIGPGDIVKGQMLLLDLNSGEKVRGQDGHRVNAGELYMNLRNAPEALATGDTIERVLG